MPITTFCPGSAAKSRETGSRDTRNNATHTFKNFFTRNLRKKFGLYKIENREKAVKDTTPYAVRSILI
jgi:hypothetical protein